ncbi:SDR family NAD(P)-dependent oxidoreductase [Pseudonocardia hydrocarbonoxydans]|uniref:Probable oxidoreductase n=1 Tax=Pseudonocardia hydrocarbonoxydans TaxID=76726 RepID=A0A4Y3WR26_9PSEU|nr:SDR family NAD(P)-dependent oxidoreductase [Pseudonocardia hydrocarbonoxydans]GEC20948.1 oxidoreductase [Pseudonocardia hydrocarbonoxydans]
MTTASRVTTPFTAISGAAEIVADVDLTGRRAIVTGGSSGIGIETARALAAANADVTIAVRDVDAGVRAAADIVASTGNDHVLVAPLDLTDQASIASFVRTWDGPLHMLVNNAGVMATPELRTREGWELQFATNHLGHFALATGLHLALAAAGDARIVSVSSSAHLRSPIVFDDVHYLTRPYVPSIAYAQSKTANVLFAVEAARRWVDDGIVANAVMPGGIRTRLQRHLAQPELGRTAGPVRWKTPAQGAATSVLLAASPSVAGVSGRYFEDCAEAGSSRPGSRTGVAAHALDPEAAARLWDESVRTLA